jgi:PhnB protein
MLEYIDTYRYIISRRLMTRFSPYLNFNGTTEQAFNFYKSIFGKEISFIQRFKDTPEGHKLSKEEGNMIMHISMPLNDNFLLLGTDALESMGQHLVMGNNFSICIEPESQEEADTLFKKLSEGGKVEMPLQKMFWGAYYGMLTDKFGLQWMINYTIKK